MSMTVQASPRRRRRLAWTGVVLAVTATALAGPAMAGATVDRNAPEFREAAGTAVYSFTKVNNVNNSNLLTVHGGGTENGMTVDTWTRFHADDKGSGRITQANQLWEFIPAADNPGGAIDTGYGQLRNRNSGRCLEVNGGRTDDPAPVDQWDCIAGAENELWTARFDIGWGAYVIQAKHSGAYLGTNTPNCRPWSPDGNGDVAYARAEASPCTLWNIQRESYRIATQPTTSHQGHIFDFDIETHRCQPAYDLRLSWFDEGGTENQGSTREPTWYWDYTNLSESGVQVDDVKTESDAWHDITNEARVTVHYLHYDLPYRKVGQVLLYCDPRGGSRTL